MTESLTANGSLRRFSDRAALDMQLAEEIGVRLRKALEQRGRASLVVSGGRTPLGLFDALSRQSLDWSRVLVTLADERWVDSDADASNERLVRSHLLRNNAAAARFIGLKTSAETAGQGVAECDKRLSQLPQQLDVVILGMGEDGHTASFFPGAAALPEALNPDAGGSCIAITPGTAPHERMTLTLARLLRSDQIYLHLCGDSKLAVVEQALAMGPVEDMPVRAVLRQAETPVSVCWAP